MRIKECFSVSKSGIEEENEDGIFIGDNFIAVIDGATSKSTDSIGGVTSGRFAMLAIKEAFGLANPYDKPLGVVKFLNDYLKNKLIEKNLTHSSERPMASVVFCNLVRNEVVSYGDCLYSISGKVYKQEKVSDRICAIKRAEIIKAALNKGVTEKEIRENDIGRLAIIEELVYYTKKFANKNYDLGFPCIDGSSPVENYLKVHEIEISTPVILASDGYPTLRDSLKQTEENLNILLSKDPLCINELLGTKCVQNGNLSYDDRSFISFEL